MKINIKKRSGKTRSQIIEIYEKIKTGLSVTYCSLEDINNCQKLFDSILGFDKVKLEGKNNIYKVKLCQQKK